MTVPGMAEGEFALIRSVILLRFILRILQRDARILKESGVLKSPELYTEMIHIAEQRASLVQEEIMAEFQQRGIKFIGLRQNDDGVEAEYVCRGYRGHMKILWPVLRREMSSRIRAYLGSSETSPSDLIGKSH
ncbi:hypothetical protein [Fontibacillus sp. BL9]|uniref:hypothetical protein n=1 Tax=Fontibacillus sp. BL9 TaxID=3389971 RepID=UPI00397D142F